MGVLPDWELPIQAGQTGLSLLPTPQMPRRRPVQFSECALTASMIDSTIQFTNSLIWDAVRPNGWTFACPSEFGMFLVTKHDSGGVGGRTLFQGILFHESMREDLPICKSMLRLLSICK